MHTITLSQDVQQQVCQQISVTLLMPLDLHSVRHNHSLVEVEVVEVVEADDTVVMEFSDHPLEKSVILATLIVIVLTLYVPVLVRYVYLPTQAPILLLISG